MIVEVRNLLRKFGRAVALDDVSFTLSDGGICGFVGPNGAGKTTAIQIMAGLDTPQCGDVLYDGVSIIDYPEKVRRCVGYMPDSLPDCTDITVRDYLEFYIGAFGTEGLKAAEVFKRVSAVAGLGGMAGKKLNQLSKGMKQRVSLARILVHDPEVLLLDEPAAGLDPRARIELSDILRSLAAAGKTVFLSSHILAELEDLCESVVVIEKGRIVKSGRLGELGREKAARGSTLFLTFGDAAEAQKQMEELRQYPAVSVCVGSGAAVLRVELPGPPEAADEFMAGLFRRHCPLAAFRRGGVRADLEELFMENTRNEVQ